MDVCRWVVEGLADQDERLTGASRRACSRLCKRTRWWKNEPTVRGHFGSSHFLLEISSWFGHVGEFMLVYCVLCVLILCGVCVCIHQIFLSHFPVDNRDRWLSGWKSKGIHVGLVRAESGRRTLEHHWKRDGGKLTRACDQKTETAWAEPWCL